MSKNNTFYTVRYEWLNNTSFVLGPFNTKTEALTYFNVERKKYPAVQFNSHTSSKNVSVFKNDEQIMGGAFGYRFLQWDPKQYW